MAVKASMHNGRGNTKHNERNFDHEKARHINSHMTDQNICRVFSDNEADQQLNFDEFEKKYYADHFADDLKRINDNYIRNRNPGRVMTMDEYYEKHPPREMILQIGNINNHVDAKFLNYAFCDFIEVVDSDYPAIKPLDFALHMDEATTHIHFRYVFEAVDEYGNLSPKMENALKSMGIDIYDNEQEEGRRNNRITTLTNELRAKWEASVEKQGLDVDRNRDPQNQHLPILEYKKREMNKDIDQLQNKKDELSKHITSLQGKENALIKKERSFKGRILNLEEANKLKDKKVWTPSDKEDLLTTVIQVIVKANRVEERNRLLEREITVLREKLNAAVKIVKELKQKVADGIEKKVYEVQIKNLKREKSDLKNDISVRDEFIIAKGLGDSFVSYPRDKGYELKIGVGELRNEDDIEI